VGLPSVPDDLPDILKREHQEAAKRGLVARFSRDFGYISLHDPGSGEWVEIPFKEAPGWAKREAFKRNELYKAGKRDDLTAHEMEEIWASEKAEMWEAPSPTPPGRKAGLIYDEDERLEEEQR